MRWSFLVLVAGCAARSELDVADASSGYDAPLAIDVTDAASEPPTPGLDAATCFALPEATCTKDAPYASVVSDAIVQCVSPSTWICGYANVTFDTNGCALAFEYFAGEVPTEFRACFEAAVSSQRWPCETGETLLVFLGSCTIH